MKIPPYPNIIPDKFGSVSRLRYAVCLFLIASLRLHADIVVAPTAVYLDEKNKSGYIVVRNTASVPKEVEISFRFGYPATNDEGIVSIFFPDTVLPGQPSAVDWLFAYPRKSIVLPGQTRTIRFMIRPPASIPDGEYWARPVITAREIDQITADTEANNTIAVKLRVNFETVIALSYRKGNVATGIVLNTIKQRILKDKLQLFSELQREGNAAYIGYLFARLRNSTGDIISEQRHEIAVYVPMNYRVEFDTKSLPPGSYSVEIELNTDRTAEGGALLKGNSVKKITPVTLP